MILAQHNILIFVPKEDGTGLTTIKSTIYDVDRSDGRSLTRAWFKYKGEPHIIVLKTAINWQLEKLKTGALRPRYHKWFESEILNHDKEMDDD